jgi:hypothetical protein
MSKPSTFLPEPRLPLAPYSANGGLPPADECDAIVPGSGDPFRAVLELTLETTGALDDLTSQRPGGGARWTAALASDADAAKTGRTPKVWATEKLLTGDYARWARASALCRTYTGRHKLALAAALDAPTSRALHAKAGIELITLAKDIEPLARDAWMAADGGSQAAAWTAYDECNALVARGTWLNGLRKWLDRAEPTFDGTGWGCPGLSKVTHGYMFATRFVLTPQSKFVHLPSTDRMSLPPSFLERSGVMATGPAAVRAVMAS